MMNIYKLVEYRLVDYRYHNELEWVSLRDLDFPQWNRFMPNFISSSSETIKPALCYWGTQGNKCAPIICSIKWGDSETDQAIKSKCLSSGL